MHARREYRGAHDGDSMLKIYENVKDALSAVAATGAGAPREVEDAVRFIIEDVCSRGDTALFEYSKKFDGVDLTSLEVTAEEIDAAFARTDPYFLETIRQAIENITEFHKRQLSEGFEFEGKDGVRLGQFRTPLERVGLYVPGGTARYPSTVLMNAVPARLAGVREIVMCTPPARDGSVDDNTLAAAKLAGVNRVFKMGGAQAVAALAFGTESVPAVDKIVGPGNVFVATAKRQVFGKVNIDMIAGPSEILVVADETANAALVAADLLSQAEHDKLARAILVTTDIELARAVQTEVARQLAALKREAIAAEAIENRGAIIVVGSLTEAISVSNEIAPEHLEICTKEPFELLKLVKNAGSVFLGHDTPEAVGDYFAGTNHTLPTSGAARFASPLSVDDFQKKTQFISYTAAALQNNGARIADFATREGLEAHALSVTKRLEDKK